MKQGIYCVVEVKGRNINYNKTLNFWLPQNTFQASKKLRLLLYENRTFNPPISDASLDKKVTFYIKGLNHINIGFLQIIAGLIKANVGVEIKFNGDVEPCGMTTQ